MTDQDRERFAKAFAGLSELFDKQLSDAALEIYFKAFTDLSIEQFERAVDVWLVRGKFFPRPAELRELVEGSLDDRAQVAWQLVLDALKLVGVYGSVQIQDSALAAAIERTFGGWIQLAEFCHRCSEEMLASKRREFAQNYRIAERQPNPGQRLYFPGQHEANNRNSVASWGPRQFPLDESGEPYFSSDVCVIAAGAAVRVRLPFSARTGALTAKAQRLLLAQAGATQALPGGDRKQLPGGKDAA